MSEANGKHKNSSADPNEPEPTALEQALELNENICSFSDLWQNDPDMQEKIDSNDWQDFMDQLCMGLDSLVSSLDELELMVYNLVAGENCCDQQQAASASSGGMLLSTADISTAPVKQLPLETQITLARQYVALEYMVVELEKIWLEDPYIQQKVDADNWQDFMGAVYNRLLELQVLFEPEVEY